MTEALNILPAGEGTLDFCAVGAMVHRLDSGIMPMRKATELKVREMCPASQEGSLPPCCSPGCCSPAAAFAR